MSTHADRAISHEVVVLLEVAGQPLALSQAAFREALQRGRELVEGTTTDKRPAATNGQEEPLVTAAEVASLVSMPEAWVYEAARRGTIPCLRLGAKAVRFRASEVVASFVASDKQSQQLKAFSMRQTATAFRANEYKDRFLTCICNIVIQRTEAMPSRPGFRNRLKHTLPTKYGQDFVACLDGRFRLTREVCNRLEALMSDLGGEGALSYQQRSMCKRAIWLELVIEHEEAVIGEGGGVDKATHTQLITSLVSIYRLLGIKRVAREARLSDYIKAGGKAD